LVSDVHLGAAPLHVMARLDSVEKAREVRRYIQYDPQPPV